MKESDPTISELEFDEIDLEAVEICFEVEDRWEQYRDLYLCIKALVSKEKAYLGAESVYLRWAMIRYSEYLEQNIVPEPRLSAALELLDELLASRTFPAGGRTFADAFVKHILLLLGSFKKAGGIPFRACLRPLPVRPKKGLRIEER